MRYSFDINSFRIMKAVSFIILLLYISSCEDERLYESFYPEERQSISGYIENHSDSFSVYFRLLEENKYKAALTAYNPYGTNYTLFLPSDVAFEAFFAENTKYNDVEDLIADREYADILTRYHVVNSAYQTNDFPFGSLADTTATGDYLTIAIDTATSRLKINGEAYIKTPNIELINGYIHIIDKVMVPVTFPVSEWLLQHQQFSIFNEALQLTGLIDTLSGEGKYTLFIETDEIYKREGINSVEDLVTLYSPEENNYNQPSNGLYEFIAYHILDGSYFLDDFEGQSANFNTQTRYPVSINGNSLNIMINKGVGILDSVINGKDTTFIDYVSLQYENSNNQAKNGAIHLINNILKPYLPGRSIVINQFYNEPAINEIKNDPQEIIFTQLDNLEVLEWTGTENLTYVKSSEEINGVWNNDYIILEGNFSLTYQVPRMLPGKYNLYLAAHANDDKNASVNISFNGNQIGGNIDLTSGGNSNNPYYNFLVGTVEVPEYLPYDIKVNTLIPGKFECDRFTFEPVNK